MESGSNVHDAGPSYSEQAPKMRIFLSHVGAQKGFVEWLCKHLSILYASDCIFLDQNMPMGVNFVQEIFQAVEECELAIVVMSPEYFRSKWPMVELEAIVKAQKSRKHLENTHSGQSKISPKKLHIVPLYYKLTVKDFRDKGERNNWREAWKKIIEENRKHLDDGTEARWLEALKTFSSTLNGCVFRGQSEEEYIEEIVKQACKLVAPSPPYNTCRVQGLERFEAEFTEKFKCLNPKEPVSFFGMYGICGTGKTRVSQLLCNQMSKEFLGKVCHVELDSDTQMKWRSKLLEVLCTWSTGKPTTQAVKDADKLLEHEISKHRLFLVLDNFQTSVTSDSRAFVELCLNIKTFKAGSVVLITSACSHEMLLRTFHYIKWKEIFPVPTLQKEEAARLLATSAGYDLSDLGSKEKMYVSKFVERCYLGFKKADRQYHPRALEILGSYIGQSPLTEWVNWNGICQQGEKEVFCKLQERFNILILKQNFTSFNKTMYFDIILTLPRDTRVSSRILCTQEDFCEWYAFTFPQAEGIIAAIEEMKRQALLVIEDCRNYWGMGNHPCHRFLIHDLYREVATLIAKGENHSNICDLYKTGDGQSYQKSRINVQNNAELSSLAKEDLCRYFSSDANIMRVVRCSKITKLDLKGLDGLRSLEIRHCPNLREVCNVQKLFCLLWEGCAVKFPSLMGMASLKLLIIQGDASNSPSMGRLSKPPGCFRLSKNSIAKMECPPNLRDCALLQVLHLSFLQDLLEFPHLGHLRHLVKLEAASCPKVRSLGGFSSLTSLEHLYLSNFASLEALPDLGELIALKHLNVTNCPKVRAIPTLQNLTNLIHLCLDTLPIEQIPGNEYLVKLEAASCPKVRSLGGLTNWTSLEHLYLSNFDSVEKLPGLGGLIALKHLNVTNCPKLSEIPTLHNLTNLMHLCLDTLPIDQIPGIEHLVKLKQLRCRHSNLKWLPDLRLVTELEHLDVSYTPVSNLDRVGTLRNLKKLEAISCMSMDKLPCLQSFTKVDVTNSLYEKLHNENF